MFANDFTELRVYQHGFELAMEAFETSKAWPREERYALTDHADEWCGPSTSVREYAIRYEAD